MPRRQRFAVAVLFGLGLIVTVAGIVRTWYIYRSLFGEYDQTWYAYPLWIAAAIEIDLGVVGSIHDTPRSNADLIIRFAHLRLYCDPCYQRYPLASLELSRVASRSRDRWIVPREVPVVHHLRAHGLQPILPLYHRSEERISSAGLRSCRETGARVTS